jgi:lycopene cyclase CruP
MSLTEKILSQVPGNPLEGLRRVDRLWDNLKQGTASIINTVEENCQPLEDTEWDAVICGGTLGILIGATLAMRGWRVALVERGILRGREQEWNISRHELQVLRDLNLLSAAELEKAIATEYNPARISFPNSAAEGKRKDIWVRDVLNVGVDPVYLLEILKQRFLDAGGELLEKTAYQKAIVRPNGVEVEVSNSSPTGEQKRTLTARLLIDGMGHFSPIVKQARGGKKPDAVCLVVGTCATGYPQNETGDIFASFTPIQNSCQYFWEAFPARDGRTTYLFTYLDAHPERMSLESFFEEYLRLLPEYQEVELERLEFKRALFGFFPCYRNSPLKTPWGRILPVGDSSGSQSPLSFGGFGAMLRHLERLTVGIDDALATDSLSAGALQLLQPYQPNISVTWLFQRSMSVGVGESLEENSINELLAGVFEVMEELGEPVLKPFLQDVVQFGGLTRTLLKTWLARPGLVIKVIPQVGVVNLLDWMVHYLNLGVYSALFPLGRGLEPLVMGSVGQTSRLSYYYRRRLEGWKYGSGGDYDNS